MKITALIILSFLLLATAAFADSDDSDYLGIQADRVSCSVSFHTSVMQAIVGKVNSASSLNEWVGKLQDDESKVKSLASGSDHKAFVDFVRGTLRQDMKFADEAVRDLRKDFRKYNVTKTMRDSLKDSYKSAQDAFKSCVSQNSLKIAQKRVDYYSKVLDRHQEQVTKLSNRNISVSELSDLITKARSTIVAPLHTAAKSGDAAQAQAALKQYCLWDGCKDGTNFHFAAKFEQIRLSALLAKITPIANAAGHSSELAAIQAQIDASKSALSAVSSADFSENTREQVWNPLKAAAQAFRKLIGSLK